MSIKVVFFGTPSFAADALTQIYQTPTISIVGVVSNPDAKVGRKQILTPSPVSEFAQKNNIPLFTPPSASDPVFLDALRALDADFFLVVSYGKILSQALIDIPPSGIYNLHFSLLPLYRGASPVQAALLNADETSGITVFRIVSQLDAGDIYAQKTISIAHKTTLQCLHEMTPIGTDMMIDLVENFERYTPVPQDHSLATFCGKIQKDSGYVDGNLYCAKQIFQMFLAYTPWPGIYSFTIDGLRVKWIDIELSDMVLEASSNTMISINGEIFWKTNDGVLKIKTIQLEGKTPSPARILLLSSHK